MKGRKFASKPSPLHPTFCPISTYSKDVFNSYFHQRIHTADRPLCHLPGDVVRWASRDAGFNRVTTIQTHCVKGLVFTVPKGIEVDVGLRSSSGARLTWIHTNAMKTKKDEFSSSNQGYLLLLPTHQPKPSTCRCNFFWDRLPRRVQILITMPRHRYTVYSHVPGKNISRP